MLADIIVIHEFDHKQTIYPCKDEEDANNIMRGLIIKHNESRPISDIYAAAKIWDAGVYKKVF